MAKILLVDDNPQNIELLSLRLTAAGHLTLEAKDGEEALNMVASDRPELMILDLQMPRVDGLQVLKTLQEDRIDIPVVVISAFATVERAVEAMKAGALDFITKPFDPTHLELVVERALERSKLENQNRFLTEELNARYHFVLGKSAGMAKAYEQMLKAAGNDDPVLVVGESGTGKEVAARLIHRESERVGGPFVTIRCGSLTADQLDVELFGSLERKGKVELAVGGVLFLDEVGKMSSVAQEKLLILIEKHGFTGPGGGMIPTDVRVIATTTVDLAEAVKAGNFDSKLNKKLGAVISLPPLRERPEDIPELASYFVEKSNREVGLKLTGVSKEALTALATYPWPGNVRELANIMERAVSTGVEEQVETTDLSIAARGIVSEGQPQGGELLGTGSYRDQLHAHRRQIVLSALTASSGETGKAAKQLGISKKTLDRLLVLLKIRK